jgi:RNA polymerase sigma-B factor
MDDMGEVGLKVHAGCQLRNGAGDVATPERRRSEERPATNANARVDYESAFASHLPLVYRLCRRFGHTGESMEDLVQVGTIGLLKAVKKFDRSRGFHFMTYAVPVIVGEIKNHLRDHGWAVKVPRKVQKHKLAVHKAVESLSQTLGRPPNIHEIAAGAGLSDADVYATFEVVNYGKPLSLDAEYDGNGSKEASSLLDYVGSEDPEFERFGDRMDIANGVECLDKWERTIIYLKFYVGLSQTEIAKQLNISQMHVSRLQRGALRKLKEQLTQ